MPNHPYFRTTAPRSLKGSGTMPAAEITATTFSLGRFMTLSTAATTLRLAKRSACLSPRSLPR